jgi:hypothetical protein
MIATLQRAVYPDCYLKSKPCDLHLDPHTLSSFRCVGTTNSRCYVLRDVELSLVLEFGSEPNKWGHCARAVRGVPRCEKRLNVPVALPHDLYRQTRFPMTRPYSVKQCTIV